MMIMDPKMFLDHNVDLIEKRCRENWIDDPKATRSTLAKIVTQLEDLRFNDDKTRNYLETRLSEMRQVTARVYVDILFRAVEGNPFYLYATNFLIAQINRMDGSEINLRDNRFLEKFRETLVIKDISIFEDFVVSSFPNPNDRYQFLLSLFNELSQKKALPGNVRPSVSFVMLNRKVERMLLSTNKMVDEYPRDNTDSKREPTASQKALIIYYRYQNLRHNMTLMEVIREVFSQEGWIHGSHKNIKNYYTSKGNGKINDPLNERNIRAILSLLNESERKKALKDLN